MRLLILIMAVLPHLLQAQSHAFEAGSYVPMGSSVRYPTQLRLRVDNELVVKNNEGKSINLGPNQVASFQWGTRKFVSIGGLGKEDVWGSDLDNRVFVEQLDSGQLTLLRYEALGNTNLLSNSTVSFGVPAASTGAFGGIGPSGVGGSPRIVIFLVRQGLAITPIRSNSQPGGGKRFRDSIMPFIQRRPDLVALLDDKRVLPEDLPLVIRALNTGQPMPPMPSFLNRE